MSTVKELQAQVDTLTAKLADKRKVSVKTKDTGTVVVYGIRSRFPVSYYPGEWDVIFAQKDAILAACTPAQRKLADQKREEKRNAS